MIALHEGWVREAASQGAQVIAFQELNADQRDQTAEIAMGTENATGATLISVGLTEGGS